MCITLKKEHLFPQNGPSYLHAIVAKLFYITAGIYFDKLMILKIRQTIILQIIFIIPVHSIVVTRRRCKYPQLIYPSCDMFFSNMFVNGIVSNKIIS